MTNQEIQKLLNDGVELLKQTTVGYANHGTAWQNNTSTKWWQGLDKIAQGRKALDAAPPPPPPPPPPPTTTDTRRIGVIRLGNDWALGSGYDRYALVCSGVQDADRCAALPATTKRIQYMSATDTYTYFVGVMQDTALANGWTLGPRIADGNGGYVLDIGNPAVRAAWLANVEAFLTQHKLDGFYADDLICDPTTLLASGKLPAAYPTVKAWHDLAVMPFVRECLAPLKAKGFYTGANAIAWFPNNNAGDVWPGTDANNGTAMAAFYAEIAPYMSFILCENWMTPNGARRKEYRTNAQWPAAWMAYRDLVNVVEGKGAHFWGSEDTESDVIYARAAFESVTNAKGGGVIRIQTGEPWTAGWTKNLGLPKGAAVQSGDVITRQFDNGSVTVNPYAGTASIS